ncbi:hypothetical protein FB548_0299 [Pseudoxanthomonas sp. 3HH-4]|uniref:hypothetical protein n=1 Tax=Pseudoxanthomonas sp. 3HH-4 TaxID=1690214 RepID=UPI001153BDA6|nr:hypothetical protein [Pseudoxanthomonas sp. 3HH-4]TQM16931.1 hypothetical protein FB548_0299 [Pseudoxanthomonas sp. 3HH-4]
MEDFAQARLRISITGIADEEFPGRIEFHIDEASGRRHRGIEKMPVVGYANQAFPCDGWIACHVLGHLDSDGRRCLEVDTSPWHVETDEGVYRFVVDASNVNEAQS